MGRLPVERRSRMARQDDHNRLSTLDKRISALKASEEERSGDHVRRAGMSGMGAGMRIAVELVAGLAVGVGIGIVLDKWLGTSPLFLIVFFILGSGASFMNVYRIANRMDRHAKEVREAAKAEAAGKSGRGRG